MTQLPTAAVIGAGSSGIAGLPVPSRAVREERVAA